MIESFENPDLLIFDQIGNILLLINDETLHIPDDIIISHQSKTKLELTLVFENISNLNSAKLTFYSIEDIIFEWDINS